jgi:predicted PilT family ATPase
MENVKKMIMQLFDDKIMVLKEDYNKAVKAGMPSSILYDEIEELKALKDEIEEIFNKEGCL